jgi:hypothetical protein
LPPVASVAPSGATETSSTNNQTEGVDEADYIKNDDQSVYAAMNGALRIIRAWPAAAAEEVAQVALPGVARKLFIQGDRALVYVSLPRETGSSVPECTYGYDCEFQGDGSATAALVFDISKRSAPRKLRQIDFDGSLLAARRIGDAVHTVLASPELEVAGVEYPELQNGCSGMGLSVDYVLNILPWLAQARKKNALQSSSKRRCAAASRRSLVFDGKLAVPLSVCSGQSFHGLVVFDVSVEDGIAERGRVTYSGNGAATCAGGWTQSSSTIKRSVFMDNFVYAISDDVMQVQDLDDLGEDIATVPLQ